jgi:aspartyl-tRNA(Asn)/glutamyl-tRNA(Gln) amidotransferase subunit B
MAAPQPSRVAGRCRHARHAAGHQPVCVEQAIRTGLGLKAHINRRSVFDRKNYFYPDLPQGYQISQYQQPIVGEGKVLVDMPDGETIEVGIERLHLEQDAGKSLHDQHPP